MPWAAENEKAVRVERSGVPSALLWLTLTMWPAPLSGMMS